MEIIDKRGYVVYRSKELKGAMEKVLDLRHLRKGLYFVTLITPKGKLVEELLIK